ncbi:MAG: uroporphyrinogen decarboxylase family protein [Armatimonadota bacterium]|nr:uroporphyrinogen decarboxylase family protein [Armatimonadota bacterium]
MTPKEVVIRAIRFQSPGRLPRNLAPEYGSDFAFAGMSRSPDLRPGAGIDEWGCVWENIGVSKHGEVKDFPLKDWSGWDKLQIPDIRDPARWEDLDGARDGATDKFLLAYGVSLYERVHFVRGLENTWADTLNNPDELGKLIDILVEMNLYAIERFAQAGADGYYFCDDWGLQKGLMISPRSWRAIWKPRYARVYAAAHEAGLLTFLHSCGDITAILNDLIEVGLDVIQMDQQENMGLELLGERFGGRITFWCPVDIQQTMAHGSIEDIRTYCRRMVKNLGRPEGGFIAQWYSDPAGAGHRPEAIEAMCEEFLSISDERSKGDINP